MSEQPREDQLTPEKGKSDPPIKPKSGKSVAIYLVILFAAAFALLLMAYFMQQRSSNEVIGNLQNSVNQFQTVDELRQETQRLQQEINRLQEENEALADQQKDQAALLEDKLAEYESLMEELLRLGYLTRNEDGSLSPARELNLDDLLVNGISLVQGPCIEPEE